MHDTATEPPNIDHLPPDIIDVLGRSVRRKVRVSRLGIIQVTIPGEQQRITLSTEVECPSGVKCVLRAHTEVIVHLLPRVEGGKLVCSDLEGRFIGLLHQVERIPLKAAIEDPPTRDATRLRPFSIADGEHLPPLSAFIGIISMAVACLACLALIFRGGDYAPFAFVFIGGMGFNTACLKLIRNRRS